jgi:hypothetical protein
MPVRIQRNAAERAGFAGKRRRVKPSQWTPMQRLCILITTFRHAASRFIYELLALHLFRIDSEVSSQNQNGAAT